MRILQPILALCLVVSSVTATPITFLPMQEPQKLTSATSTFTLSDGTPIQQGPGLICSDETGGFCSLDGPEESHTLSFLIPTLTAGGVTTGVIYYITHRHRSPKTRVSTITTTGTNAQNPPTAVPENPLPIVALMLAFAFLRKLRRYGTRHA